MTDWWSPYIGVPYAESGRSLLGSDCWGLLWVVYKEVLGVELPCHEHEKATDLRKVAGLIEDGRRNNMWNKVDLDQTEPFDILIMKAAPRHARMRIPIHCGVVTSPGVVLHVEKATNALLARFRDNPETLELASVYNKNRADGAYRYAS